MLAIIVAIGEKNEIGRKGTMPWQLPKDLQHFKELTLGHDMLMGCRTFESLPGVLPKRQHIVVSDDPNYRVDHQRVRVSYDLEKELREAQKSDELIFVIGGGMVYTQALPFADILYLTLVHETYPDADTYFPAINWEEWQVEERSEMMTEGSLAYEFVTLRKKS